MVCLETGWDYLIAFEKLTSDFQPITRYAVVSYGVVNNRMYLDVQLGEYNSVESKYSCRPFKSETEEIDIWDVLGSFMQERSMSDTTSTSSQQHHR